MTAKWHLSKENVACKRWKGGFYFFCLPEIKEARLLQADRKAGVTEITACSNHGMQKTISEPFSRWASAAEDHHGCHSNQLRTGTEPTIHNTIGQQKIGKCCSV